MIRRRPNLVPSDAPHPRVVLQAVCLEWQVPRELLLAHDPRRRWMTPRNAAAYLLHRCFGYSSTRAGHALHRNHTTVLDAVRSAEARMRTDEEFAARIEMLRRMVASGTQIGELPATPEPKPATPEPKVEAGLSADQIGEIRRLRARGGSLESIAKRTGLDKRDIAPVIGVSLVEVGS